MMKKKFYYLLLAVVWGSIAHAQITVYPNFTDFESEVLCGTSCTGSCNPAGTWRNADQWGFAQAGTDWLVDEGGTPSSSTGPSIDHTLGTNTGNYMYTESSGCNNVSAHLVSAIFDFSSLTAPKIRFWYHMFGASQGTMHFDVDTTGLGNWVNNVTPAWTDNQNVWLQRTIDLSAYAGRPSVRLRIRATTGISFTSDMAIDDIEVYEPAANDVEVLSVSAGGGCGNSVNTPVEITFYNAGSDSIAAGDTLILSFMIGANTVLDTLISTNGIAPGDTLTYTFVNGGADLSGPSAVNITAWVDYSLDLLAGNDTATTTSFGIPIISTYPYFENFESGQNGWLINNGTVGTWAFGTPAKTVINSASSGVNCFVSGGLTGSYNNNDNSYVEGPCFDLSNVCDPVISARIWWNAEFSWDGLNITASTDGGITWVLIGAFGDQVNWYNDNTIAGNPGGYQSGWSGRNSSSNGSGGWVTVKHRLNGLGGIQNVKIRFNFGSDGSVIDDGVAFDDVRISNGPWVGEDLLACSPATVALDANVGGLSDTYLWNTGATTSAITVTSTGWYSVATTGPSCTTTDSIYVVVVDSLTAVDLGADTTSCGDFLLDAGYWPSSTFLWNTGATSRTITATTGGAYSVDVVTTCGTLSDTIVVNIQSFPIVNLGADTTACGSYSLDAGAGGATYSWSNGSAAQTINVTTSGVYSVVVSDSLGCSAGDSVNITVSPTPVVNLGADQILCDGATAILDAGNAGSSFLWSNGSTAQTASVSSAGNYFVAVTDSLGCMGMDTVVVTTANTPNANFSSSVGGAGLDYTFTPAFSGATSYAWDFGDGNTSTQQSPTHTFAAGSYSVTLIVTNDCGSDTSTQSIMVVGLDAQLGNGSLVVFPNPNQGHFQVAFELAVTESVTMTLSNLAGQVVYSSELGMVSGRVEREVTLSELPAGVYMLRLRSESAQAVKMLRVE